MAATEHEIREAIEYIRQARLALFRAGPDRQTDRDRERLLDIMRGLWAELDRAYDVLNTLGEDD